MARRSSGRMQAVQVRCLYQPKGRRAYDAAFTAETLASGIICVKCGRHVPGTGSRKHRIIKGG